MSTRRTPSQPPARKKTLSQPAPRIGQPATGDRGTSGSSKRFILGALAVILALGLLQLLLLLTVADDKLKPLDKNADLRIQIVRVLDLDFPFMSEAEFTTFVEHLQATARRKLGFRITLEPVSRILNDNFLSPGELFVDREAADSWFRSQLAVSRGWQTNFAWLTSILLQPSARTILSRYYGKTDQHALELAIRRDFTRRIANNLAIRDIRGRRVFDDVRRQALSSTAYWYYLLGKQTNGDLVICNMPIFFPSALTPPDAVTRGGLITSLVAGSSRPLGGAIVLSSFPVFGRRQYSRDNAMRILVELGVQSLGRLLHRLGFESENRDSLLFPALGDDLISWYTNGSRMLNRQSAQTIKRF